MPAGDVVMQILLRNRRGVGGNGRPMARVYPDHLVCGRMDVPCLGSRCGTTAGAMAFRSLPAAFGTDGGEHRRRGTDGMVVCTCLTATAAVWHNWRWPPLLLQAGRCTAIIAVALAWWCDVDDGQRLQLHGGGCAKGGEVARVSEPHGGEGTDAIALTLWHEVYGGERLRQLGGGCATGSGDAMALAPGRGEGCGLQFQPRAMRTGVVGALVGAMYGGCVDGYDRRASDSRSALLAPATLAWDATSRPAGELGGT